MFCYWLNECNSSDIFVYKRINVSICILRNMQQKSEFNSCLSFEMRGWKRKKLFKLHYLFLSLSSLSLVSLFLSKWKHVNWNYIVCSHAVLYFLQCNRNLPRSDDNLVLFTSPSKYLNIAINTIFPLYQ